MHLHLGGHLSWYVANKRTNLELELSEPVRLIDLLLKLGVPPSEIAVATRNKSVVPLEIVVTDNDRIELFPPVGGG
jgi:sulfur carrier protein ThiS